jgi:hypothetical protein
MSVMFGCGSSRRARCQTLDVKCRELHCSIEPKFRLSVVAACVNKFFMVVYVVKKSLDIAVLFIITV